MYKPRGRTPYGRRKEQEQRILSRSFATDADDTHIAGLHPYADAGDDTGVESGQGSITSTPPWVYVSGIIVIVLILLFVIQHLTCGGLGGHAP